MYKNWKVWLGSLQLIVTGSFIGGKPEYTGFVSKWPGVQVRRSLKALRCCLFFFFFITSLFKQVEVVSSQRQTLTKTEAAVKLVPGRGGTCWSQREAKPQLLPDRSVCSNASLFWRYHLRAKKHLISFKPNFSPQPSFRKCSAAHPPIRCVLSWMNLASTSKVCTFDSESMKIRDWRSLLKTNWPFSR